MQLTNLLPHLPVRIFIRKHQPQIHLNIKPKHAVNLISISYGTSAGWPSASSVWLLSDKLSPLAGDAAAADHLTAMNQLSWIAALMGVGGLVGSILFGWLSNHTGRKISLCLLAVPSIVKCDTDFVCVRISPIFSFIVD